MIKNKNMPIPYSYDLRVKVMEFLEEKNSVKEASKLFKISCKTVMSVEENQKIYR